MENEKIHLFVRGRVQGVGFRQATRRRADELGIGGWVRNVEDGRVEISALGEKAAIARLVDWCHHGPGTAAVESVEIVSRGPVPDTAIARFEVRK